MFLTHVLVLHQQRKNKIESKQYFYHQRKLSNSIYLPMDPEVSCLLTIAGICGGGLP